MHRSGASRSKESGAPPKKSSMLSSLLQKLHLDNHGSSFNRSRGQQSGGLGRQLDLHRGQDPPPISSVLNHNLLNLNQLQTGALNVPGQPGRGGGGGGVGGGGAAVIQGHHPPFSCPQTQAGYPWGLDECFAGDVARPRSFSQSRQRLCQVQPLPDSGPGVPGARGRHQRSHSSGQPVQNLVQIQQGNQSLFGGPAVASCQGSQAFVQGHGVQSNQNVKKSLMLPLAVNLQGTAVEFVGPQRPSERSQSPRRSNQSQSLLSLQQQQLQQQQLQQQQLQQQQLVHGPRPKSPSSQVAQKLFGYGEGSERQMLDDGEEEEDPALRGHEAFPHENNNGEEARRQRRSPGEQRPRRPTHGRASGATTSAAVAAVAAQQRVADDKEREREREREKEREREREKELEEARTRAMQMEKTMRWWSDCASSWREKWGKARTERNESRDENRQLKQRLDGLERELHQIQMEKDRAVGDNQTLREHLEMLRACLHQAGVPDPTARDVDSPADREAGRGADVELERGRELERQLQAEMELQLERERADGFMSKWGQVPGLARRPSFGVEKEAAPRDGMPGDHLATLLCRDVGSTTGALPVRRLSAALEMVFPTPPENQSIDDDDDDDDDDDYNENDDENGYGDDVNDDDYDVDNHDHDDIKGGYGGKKKYLVSGSEESSEEEELESLTIRIA